MCGRDVATLKIPKTIPFLLPADETFDVGSDTRTAVNDKDYQVPFRFNGKIDKLTFKLGPEQLTSGDHQVIQHARARAETRRRMAICRRLRIEDSTGRAPMQQRAGSCFCS